MKMPTPTLPLGLRYIPNFLTIPQSECILQLIMSHRWCSILKRQQQYYGIKYYQTSYPDSQLQNAVSHHHYPLDPFSDTIQKIKRQLGVFRQSGSPNQVLVNKYLQTDRLSMHVEDVQAFGDTIVGITLGSTDYLRLHNISTNQELKVKVEDRSAYVLQGEARYLWRHGIGRVCQGVRFKEKDFMRVSLTFRDVIDTRRKL